MHSWPLFIREVFVVGRLEAVEVEVQELLSGVIGSDGLIYVSNEV